MRRLQEDVALVHGLAKCTQPGDVFNIYSAFIAKGFSDYRGEYTQLATLSVKGFESTSRASQETVDNIARAMPAAA